MHNPQEQTPQPEIPDYAEFMPLSEEEAAIEATRLLNSSRVGTRLLEDIDQAEAAGELDKLPDADIS